MSALAAKGAVDNIVNMEGVITVASAEVRGGKIILSGGDSGKVSVSGKMDASGTTGGEIDVTGQNAEIAGTAELSADGTAGDGGSVEMIAAANLEYHGAASAIGGENGKGGFIETSGSHVVVDGTFKVGDGGEVLVDPVDLCVFGAGGVCGAMSSVDFIASIRPVLIGGGLFTTTNAAGPGDGDVVIVGDLSSGGFVSAARGTWNVVANDDVIIGDDGSNATGLFSQSANLVVGGAGLNLNLVSLNGPGAALPAYVWFHNGSTVNTGGGDVSITADDFNMQPGATLNAGAGAISFTRATSGDISVGDNNGGLYISQVFLNNISAGELVFGSQAGVVDENVIVENANTTHVAKTTINTQSPAGPFDANFKGLNLFGALEVNAEDDIILEAGASIETNGDALFNADADFGGAGDFVMRSGSSIDTNGNNVTVHTGAFAGAVAESVLLESGAVIDAEGGNIDFNNEGVFNSVDADSVRTSGTGTVEIEQFDGGSIQNAVDAVENTGTGTNTINVHAGTYAEAVTVAEDNFILNGANSGLHGNDAGRGPESIVTPNSPGFLITGNNAVIDGFEIVGGEAGVIVDGGNNAIIRNNNIHGQFAPSGEGASFGAPGEGDGIYVTNSAGTKILRNKIADYNDDGVQASGVSDFEIADNLITDNGNGDLGIGVSHMTGTLDITGNTIVSARRLGVQVLSSTVTADISGNIIANAATTAAGIAVQGTNGDISIDDNIVRGGLIGINIHTSDNVLVGDKDGDNDSGNLIIGSGRGISVYGTTNAEVIDNTLTGVDSGIAGIQSENIQIADNDITGASTIGIDIINSDSADVDNNIVKHFTTGIRVTNSALVDVEGNRISDIADNAVEVKNAALAEIRSNVIGDAVAHDIGGDGIHVEGSLGVGIFRNIIGNVDGDGIEIISSDSASIGGFGPGERNTIRNAGGHGITSSFSTSPDIVNNDISFVQLSGIHLNGGSDAQVLGNLIDLTAQDGIEANNNSDIQIVGNAIGTRVGGYSIGGEGIDVNNSPSADIIGNVVMNTTSNGISINPSHGSVIQGNAITNAGAHGIFSTGSDNIVIRANRIDLTVQDGIRFANGNTVTIDRNNISNTGRGGIWAHNSSNVTIDDNDVFNAGTATTWSGIVANNNDGVRITRNRVDTTSFDGIHAGFNPGNVAAANTNVVINGNTVQNALVRGIYSVGGTLSVNGNTVHDTQLGQGIRIDNSPNVTANGNTIYNTGNDGVEVNNSAAAQIIGNLIGFFSLPDGIGGEGIDVNNSPAARIINNFVTETASNGISINPSPGSVIQGNVITNAGANGILVLSSDNTLVGGPNAGDENTVTNSGQSGIRVHGSGDVTVERNIVNGTVVGGDHNGIFVTDSTGTNSVLSNRVSNAGWDGIKILNGPAQRVIGNVVTDSHLSGIAMFNTHNSLVQNNDVDRAGTWGLRLDNLDGSIVSGNEIDTTGNDGIEVNGSDGIQILSNRIGTNGGVDNISGEGIDVNNSPNSTINNNVVTETVSNGVSVNPSPGSVIQGNLIVNVGADGILVVSSDGTLVGGSVLGQGNTILNAGDDGINIVASENASVVGNNIIQTGDNGIEVVNGSHGTLVEQNRIDLAGWDGVNIQNSNNIHTLYNIITNTIGASGIAVINSANNQVSWNLVRDAVAGGLCR
ncbi:MAG: right-handed parallel beta-helix repeat-containing protein [Alphaproteobacteria bacterium]